MDTPEQNTIPEQSQKEKLDPISIARRGTGPRTRQGKQKSKRNALKYGIFSREILLDGESQVELESLRDEYRNYFRPEGAPEEIIVDKLVCIAWRDVRRTRAERCEIEKRQEFLEWDPERQQEDQADKIPEDDLRRRGLMRMKANPKILDSCLMLLEKLKEYIEESGFDGGRDATILLRLYGEAEDYNERENIVFRWYNLFRLMAKSEAEISEEGKPDVSKESKPDVNNESESDFSEEGEASTGKEKNVDLDAAAELFSPESCKRTFTDLLGREIRLLEKYRKERDRIESKKLDVEWLRGSVPDSPQLDRLVRYEITLGREFDRALNQLERLQRARKGQPLPPTLNVDVSS